MDHIASKYCRLHDLLPDRIYKTVVIVITRHLACTLFLVLLLFRSGDVEKNPGPNSPDTSSDTYLSLLSSGLSVMHVNIQSLRPKLDILSVEAQPYDILVFTETWLSSNIPNTELHIPNFSPPFRCDRHDRMGGGVAIYIRDSLHAVARQDLHLHGLEALWVELRTNQRTVLVGGVYRPPASNNNYWMLLEQGIDQAFQQHCDNIIVTGDFNIDISLSPSNKMSRLISSYNATQLISTPTHFTEHSQSLIDLIFVKNNGQVITSFVADPFVPDLVRFHCPTVAVLKFSKPKHSGSLKCDK